MKSRTLILTGSLATVAVLIIFLFVSSRFNPPLKVVSVSPSPNNTETSLLPEITVTFDKEVRLKDISLLSNPYFDYEVTPSSANILKFTPKQILDKSTTYQIEIQINKEIKYSWSFTTGESEAGAVPGWAEGFRKAEEQYRANHPPEEVDALNNIIEQMPYFTNDFWIEYSLRTYTFTVSLCRQPHEQTKTEVQNWFNSQGFEKLKRLQPQIEWLYGCEPPSRAKNPPQTPN